MRILLHVGIFRTLFLHLLYCLWIGFFHVDILLNVVYFDTFQDFSLMSTSFEVVYPEDAVFGYVFLQVGHQHEMHLLLSFDIDAGVYSINLDN